MGNRAVITPALKVMDERIKKSSQVGIYLHWNGGRDSIDAFLKYCEIKRYRSPDKDSYGLASLITVITNFFGNTGNSIGVAPCKRLDCHNHDNGVYLIKDWKVTGRVFEPAKEQDEYNSIDMLQEIDKAQPEQSRLGVEAINKYMEGDNEK